MSIVHVGHPPNDWDGCESHVLHFHNFACLPSGKNERVSSPKFSSVGNKWIVRIFPGGVDKAEEGNISLFLWCVDVTADFSYQIQVLVKNNSGGADIGNYLLHKFTDEDKGRGWPNVASRTEIMSANFLKKGTLTVEVRMRPEKKEDRWQHFIPKNPFVQNMMQLFLDEETADMSFKVEPQLNDTSEDSLPALSEVFHAHKLVVKICAKGSFLASLCEDCDGSTPLPITNVVPKVFRLMLRYVYGGDLSAADWKDHAKDLIEAADKYGLTNLKIEAEARYVKLLKFSPGDAVETVAYAEKMNCFLLKEAAIDFIVANVDEVMASGTHKNIPESKEIIWDIMRSVSTMKQQGQKRKIDSGDLNQLSMDDLRACLESKGKDFDGSKEDLVARLKKASWSSRKSSQKNAS